MAMKNQIINILVFQYVLGASYLAGTGLWDIALAPSALLGCVAALLPKTYFSFRMLRATKNNNAVVLFAGFVLIQISGWFTPFVTKGN